MRMLSFLLMLLVSAGVATAAEPKSLVGINTDFITYYSPA